MKKIALVDDHVLVRNGLAEIINAYPDYTVLFEADNGKHFIGQLNPLNLPDIILLDISMPEMNGFETACWLKDNYPNIKFIALSMINDERSIIQMLYHGAMGYLSKDVHPNELKKAMDAVHETGIYINEIMYRNFMYTIKNGVAEPQDEYQKMISLPEREKEFLKWLCTEKSLKEIAAEMHLSPRTIDGYRDNLFEKIKVNSRVGLVLFAIRNNLVRI